MPSSKRKHILYEERIELIRKRLSTGKSGFANKHKDRVTFKNYIEWDIAFARKVEDYDKIYNKNSTNQDVDNILILFTANLGIPAYIADRAKFILAKTWNNKGQKQNYNKILYEIAVLGILKFCCNDLKLDINYKEFIRTLFPTDTKIKRMEKMRQFNRAYKKVCELYTIERPEVIRPKCDKRYLITPSDKIKIMDNYRSRHLLNVMKLNKVEIIFNHYQELQKKNHCLSYCDNMGILIL